MELQTTTSPSINQLHNYSLPSSPTNSINSTTRRYGTPSSINTDNIPHTPSTHSSPSPSSNDPQNNFQSYINNQTKEIIQKLNEGKSLTRKNKEKIIEILHNIQTKTEIFTQISQNNLNNNNQLTHTETIKVIRNTIQEEITKLNTTNHTKPNQKPTYAKITSTSPAAPAPTSTPINKPAIIISAKNQAQSPNETLQLWKQTVTFRNTNYTPNRIQQISNNKLRIEFDNTQQRSNTLDQINNNPLSPISAELSRELKPTIILKGIHHDTPTDLLVELITKQNQQIQNAITNDTDLVHKFNKKNKNPKLYNAIFTTSTSVWKAITSKSNVNIDHQRIHVEEYIPLLQCFDCLQFGHTRKTCKIININSLIVCSHCAGNHSFKTCPNLNKTNSLKCFNCSKNTKTNSTISINHSATSSQCPKVAYMKGKIRAKINYGYNE